MCCRAYEDVPGVNPVLNIMYHNLLWHILPKYKDLRKAYKIRIRTLIRANKDSFTSDTQIPTSRSKLLLLGALARSDELYSISVAYDISIDYLLGRTDDSNIHH